MFLVCAFCSYIHPFQSHPFRLSGFLKTKAPGALNGLPLMKHEKWILEEKLGEAAECKVPQAVIAQMKAARVCAEEILNDAKRVGAFSDIKALMKSNSGLLLALDGTFLLELEWLGQHGEGVLVQAVHKQILSCFPTSSVNITLNQAILKLDGLLKDEMIKFSSMRSHNEPKTIKKLAAAMMQGMSPKDTFAAGGGIFKQVWDALPNFLRVPAIPK